MLLKASCALGSVTICLNSFAGGTPPAPSFVLTPSGGTASGTNGNHVPQTNAYSSSSSGYGGLAGSGFGDPASTCNGTVTLTYTWSGSATTAPASAVVAETSTASWTGKSGSCDDGRGDKEVDTSPVPGAPPSTGTSTGTHYSVHDTDNKGTFTITLSPSSTCTQGSCKVNITCLVTPVVITVKGTVLTSSGLKTYAGVHQVATMTAGPYFLEKFQYSVTGKHVYKTSLFGANKGTHSWTPLNSQDLDIQSVTYADGGAGPDVISCSANVYLDSELQNLIGTCAANNKVQVVIPQVQMELLSSNHSALEAIVNGSTQNSVNDPTYLNSTNFPGIGELGAGICFTITGTQDSDLSSTFSVQIASAQIANAAYLVTYSTGDPFNFSGVGLDSGFPYMNDAVQIGQKLNPNDTPGFGILENHPTLYGLSARSNSSFIHFGMFQATMIGIVSDYVPFEAYNWTWNTSASLQDRLQNFLWSSPIGDPANGSDDTDPFSKMVWTSTAQ